MTCATPRKEVNMEYLGISANHVNIPHPESGSFLLHAHDSYEIFLPLSDGCVFETDTFRYHIERGCVLLLAPDEEHRLIVPEHSSLEYLYTQFTILPPYWGEDLAKATDALFHKHKAGGQHMWRLTKPSTSFVLATAKRLCSLEDRDIHKQYYRLLSPLLHEILLYGTPVCGENSIGFQKVYRQNLLTDQIIEYIGIHYADIRDLSFVNREFHYSTVYVNSLFKKRLGISLWHYILHVRLDRACDFLMSGAKAEDAAAACGFGDYSTFYRIFKKCYGTTPTECRKAATKPKMIV